MKRRKFSEPEYFEWTPKQLAPFQPATRRPPGAKLFRYAPVAGIVLIVVWRVLAHWGYFV